MKKLIETALPLDVINKASAKEKSIRHGHPSTLHLWWARRPLATARAVIFASLVDDPAEHPEKFPTPESQKAERKRLFGIIEKLVQWENSSNEKIFSEALAEIKKSVGEDLPAIFDPFAGGGTIPLEAQRLGLKSFAADLNPVAVMINKAMIEIPAQFKDKPPINPPAKKTIGSESDWHGANGLANDILYYGKILKEKAFDELKNLYPEIEGKKVIAWLWTRTVKCSNPACSCRMPLVHSFKLSTKQKVFARPIVEGNKIRFEISRYENEKNIPEGTVNRNGAKCLFCGANVPLAHVRAEAKAGRMSAQLMAIVAEGQHGRIYLPPNEEHEKIADIEKPDDYPSGELPEKALGFRVQEYGITEWHQLFTNRQLKALMTFSDLIPEIQSQVLKDGKDKNYSNALAVYLTFLVDRLANKYSSFCVWNVPGEKIEQTFGRQAIPMVWFFAEANPFSNSSGCFDNMLGWIYENLKEIPAQIQGEVFNHSALKNFPIKNVMVSTDPPYYDNIGYADLSEFFYVWMRRPLKNIYPRLFGRISFSKNEELIASPYRHEGNKSAAKNFFEDGMFQALKNIYEVTREDFPTTIYYAFKQQDKESDGATSTGWETMLTSLIKSGFQITATLPMRTERPTGLKVSVNALASSIVLVCRKRPLENDLCLKNEFLRDLKSELKETLSIMQQANIAPVDMAQAAIGPGISVYSRFEKIIDRNDNELSVREALKIINTELAEFFGTQTGRLDAASQFCVDLFTQRAFNEITFGEADVLARAKNISVGSLENMGAVISSRGQVRLRDRDEMPILIENHQLNKEWIKKLADANCAWLWVQSLVEAFRNGGVSKAEDMNKENYRSGAAELLSKFDGDTDLLRNLAYRLYDICEKRNWAREGTVYNEPVAEWQEILDESVNFKREKPFQENLF